MNINLYKAMLCRSRYDINTLVDIHEHKIYRILNQILESNDLPLKNNDKIYLLRSIMPSISYLYYSRCINCKYSETKRILKRLKIMDRGKKGIRPWDW